MKAPRSRSSASTRPAPPSWTGSRCATTVRPLLVVERTYRPVTSFLIAYDGSPSATKALDFVVASPLLKGATCHIIRAGQVDDKAKWFLNEAADKLRAGGYTVTSQATGGPPRR